MKTFHKKEFSRLIDAYLAGTADENEIAALEKYYDQFSGEADVTETFDLRDTKETHDRLKSIIDQRIYRVEKPAIRLTWKRISIAASILLAAAAGFYFYNSAGKHSLNVPGKEPDPAIAAVIIPGSNKAILTLSNGTKISLTDAKAGQVAEPSGVSVNKTKDGTLVYAANSSKNNEVVYNSVETPKGGQYQVNLPDGTKVWLNAASSLRYPLEFAGNERKVELIGEAYFEVAKNKAKPFKVYTDKEIVEVIGTHFNINAYTDESSTRTSLVEGSVKVTSVKSAASTVIKPGQQSVINANAAITIKEIDIDEAVAWKNGYFMFDAESLESILRKVSRWYDVDIQYKGVDLSKGIYFSGTLSKYSDVAKVLNKLEMIGAVHFKIEGRKIIVLP